MMAWDAVPKAEIERRRLASIDALNARERSDFDAWYQEKCDKDYWTFGKCCAGCDHWSSDMGNLGHCISAGIVSGDQVMRSMGIKFCSYTPAPGFPLTQGSFYCGMFCDNFDWAELKPDYLRRIGAMIGDVLKTRPQDARA